MYRKSQGTRDLIRSFEEGRASSGGNKHVLIVFAHPDSRSFNGALYKRAKEVLEGQGHVVETSDLYSMNFDPRTTIRDVQGEVSNPKLFKWQMETQTAWEQSRLAEDLKVEVDKLQRADLVIFQFPLYWFSFPAILKGWMDRVFVMGFAYGGGKPFGSEGPMKGKKVLISFTTGGPPTSYSTVGFNGDMNIILWPMQHAFNFCGFSVLAPHICYSVARVSQEERTAMLENWGRRLAGVFKEETLTFVPSEGFRPDTLALTEKLQEEAKNSGIAPTIGQHGGLPFPKDNML